MNVLDTFAVPDWLQSGEGKRPSRISVICSHDDRWKVPLIENSFWTSGQRKGHSLHEISYRACFKPELPHFFIRHLTKPGDWVSDCFMGRGTTLLEASLLGRRVWGSDLNPISRMMIEPRLEPPKQLAVEERLREVPWGYRGGLPRDLLVFFHPNTLRSLLALRKYFHRRQKNGQFDKVDSWIRMVAMNRLTGHSPGFFSVYTLPPNQAVSVEAQRRINQKRNQTPPFREVPERIVRKSKSLLRDIEKRRPLAEPGWRSQLLSRCASSLDPIESESIDLVVTSPPFLDTINYRADNWMRAWFCEVSLDSFEMADARSLEKWKASMLEIFREQHRILRPGGWFALEVGEIRKGELELERHVLELGGASGFIPAWVVHHTHRFTKTAHCWGIRNGKGGTNSQRIVVFRKTVNGTCP